ncbi:MAG TPA: sigma factor-like helix-turn-helix DNA-binding protein [Clostridia bacterium]|jgi:predicted DNA-binding protein YlxM (UPF0122 family)|nr:sigma factor-like helix-turn-helix DNA-binding protein [Clostridia bacterium]
MQDKITIGLLNDYYGGILNSHQQEIMRLYFDCDMSLAEISQELGITRQAVREVLVRSTAKLNEMEKKLQLMEKLKTVVKRLCEIIDSTEDENTRRELNELLRQIREI